MKMGFHVSLTRVLLLLTLCILGCSKGCVERERLALLDFKISFASFPQNYGKLSSWNSNDYAKDCCRWEGITCDNHTRHVVSLDLFSQFLESHQLRPSLLELQHLRSLNLSYNNLAMRIPKFFGSFSKLTSLDLWEAGFFGMIPPQLGNLSKIQILALGSSNNNMSTDNFQWLSHFSSLEILHLSSINFTKARDCLLVIKKLPILSRFFCEWCYFPTDLDLSSIVAHHVNFSSSLQTLVLFKSYLSSSAVSLLMNDTCNLSLLALVDLQLEVPLPGIFNDLNSLESVYLFNIQLEDGIFNSIGNLCNLKELIAVDCTIKQSLVDVVQAFTGCSTSSLTDMALCDMFFTGTIPPMLKFQSLIALDLSGNSLDILPNTFPLFPASLTQLHLQYSHLSGVLSNVHFTNFSHLQDLRLVNNPNLTISFNKPPTEMQLLNLRFCNLGPNFPSWLLTKNSLVVLDISYSNISGKVPFKFWRNLSPFLTDLDLSSNNLYGIVPNIPFRFFYSEITIDLSSNAFYGPIPFFFFMAHGLYLSNNNFSSFAPISHPYNLSTSLPNPSFMEYGQGSPQAVDISSNLLSGLIPHWLWFHMPKLGALVLANNNLSGKIPSSIGHAIDLYVLNLSNNSFCGQLPSVLKNCAQLMILDLSGNRFSGFIPSWMGEELKNLSVLSLRSNSLTSIVPTSLCHLSSLQILDLSHNKLSGNIPSCIHNFNAMAHDVHLSRVVFYLDEGTDGTEYLELASYYNAWIKWKSKVWKFQHTLYLVKLIDLSSNNLTGEIPTGLAALVELDSIDLSCNHLQGSIPAQIGQLKSLQVLNLSSNRLRGQIPQSLSMISALEMLDLSHNNLSGRIPKGTQLQTFDPSAFAGNPQLCGLPLRNKCPGEVDDSVQPPRPSPIDDSEMEEKWRDRQCFYAGLGAGFASGFFGILGTLTWIRKWRIAFFQFSIEFGEWILLVLALSKSKISRKLGFK